MREFVFRGIATVLAVMLYGWTNFLLNPVSTILTGQLAGKQFENSNTAYVVSQVGMNFFSNLGIPAIVLLGVIVAIWWTPGKKLVAGLFAALLLAALFAPQSAFAFAETTDKTEFYTVLPNESAFWIPDVGANKDNQVKFDSEQYLEQNKVAVKRFQVPHTKLAGTGGTSLLSGWDLYVPTGRLIKVDRSPFSREWVVDEKRGTSSKDESFHCQSKEGLNVGVGVAIGASVSEQNAAKFLFNFGVKAPDGKPDDPKVIFTSLYYGRSLTEVMDDFGRKKVSELICDQITVRSFDKVNEEAKLIKDNAAQTITTYLAQFGITVQFVGWADTFTFDPEVQAAVNRLYIAKQDELVAAKLQPYADTIKALAVAQAMRSFGEKTDGKLPSTFMGLPPEMVSALLGQPAVAVKASPAGK